MHDAIRDGSEDHVGHLGGDSVGQRLFGVQVAQGQAHECFRAGNVGGGALDHRDLGRSGLPKGGADVMGRVVGAQNHAVLPGVGVGCPVGRRVMNIAVEAVGTRELRDVGLTRHAGGHHQLLRSKGDVFG